MSLQFAAKEVIGNFEKTISPDQFKKLDEINNLFEKMVAKGLITPPTYNLEPISTLSVNLIMEKTAK
jgi:hypothetical protein